MDEIMFRKWLIEEQKQKVKIASDSISRLRRIEKEFGHCDLDEQYRNDRCELLMKAFLNMGLNEEMKKYPDAKFPIGKYHMSTYRHSLKQYITFLDSLQ